MRKSMTGTLEKVTNGVALRTQTVYGETAKAPTKGRRFVLIGEPLDPTAKFRMVETSPVVSVERPAPGVWLFKTVNSVYRFVEEQPHDTNS